MCVGGRPSALSAANGACLADQADAALEVLACYVKHDYKELTARQEFVLTYLLTYTFMRY